VGRLRARVAGMAAGLQAQLVGEDEYQVRAGIGHGSSFRRNGGDHQR